MEDIRAGRPVRILPNEAELHGKIFGVFPTRKHLPPKVRTFLDFLAKNHFLGPQDAPDT